MVTSKKLRQRKKEAKLREEIKEDILREGGLLHGPSRKQLDWQSGQTGDILQQQERHATQVFTGTTSGFLDTTVLYTCPVDKKGKITYYYISGQNAAGILYINNVEIVRVGSASTTDLDTQRLYLGYPEAIDITSGQIVRLSNFSHVGDLVATILVVEEDAISSYTTPT